MRTCANHHDACDCREAMHADEKDRLQDVIRRKNAIIDKLLAEQAATNRSAAEARKNASLRAALDEILDKKSPASRLPFLVMYATAGLIAFAIGAIIINVILG